MRHRDCEIRITCDGEALDEHNVQLVDNTVECYVASEAGKIFEIICSNHSSSRTSSHAMVDGREFPRRWTLAPQSKDVTFLCEDGIDGFKPLMFSMISVTDDESAARELPWANDLGLVQIKVVRAEVVGAVPWSPPSIAQAQNFGHIHETVKKGGLHCVSFGPKTLMPDAKKQLTRINCIDDWSTPYVTFKFRYRPLDILQAQGIVEPPQPVLNDEPGNPSASRDTSPVTRTRRREDEPAQPGSVRPQKRQRQADGSSSVLADSLADELEDERSSMVKDEDDESADDLDTLEAQMQAIRRRIDSARTKKIRGSGQRRIVKREPSPIQVGGFNGGVIDLTDD
ncbi:uncharacterized protein C8Q71DRAFT_774721 [Rhodofomes roseus]|uniref:DUF7918 domain-containing protein n=1 Tax=Rhodofomes roseus TaxID=34475 RepID=A0ABQ8K7W1_9APHY|nr:uncharacterized protein C8Q71DRAFT_774721 [Rhodofomes roseus]KAH9833229.1 hypothetical protein C8Q71DRAFT_774721 [Rhodofomes roseus]